MLAELLIFLLCSLGCFFVYATSQNQRLFEVQQFRWQQLPRSIIWLIFVFAQVNSLFLLADSASWPVALIKIVVVNSVLWISLTLLASHWPLKPVRVSTTIFSGFLCLLLLGI